MPLYSYLIFDLDGTLDNSMPHHTNAFVTVCVGCGLDLQGIAERYNDSAGMPLRQQFSQAFASSALQFDLEYCMREFWKIMDQQKANPFPNVQDVMRSLASQQYRLYLTTGSKTENAQRRMKEMNVDSYFELMAGDEKTVQKGPAHIQRFKEHCGDSFFEQRALYLGDGTGDMQLAKKCGITAIGVTATLPAQKLRDAGAVYIISDIAKFIPLLQKMESEKR